MFHLPWSRSKTQLRDAVELRLEAIGGQGAHSAGKIIAEAAVLGMGFSGQHFSSFGSEKRGSPVKSFVRFYRDKRPIRASSPVRKPQILVVFHEALIEHNPEILDGSGPETQILINSPLPPGKVELPQGTIAKSITTVDASKIAEELGCGLNSVLLGALTTSCPEISSDALEETLIRFFAKLPNEKINAIRAGFEEGRKQTRESAFKAKLATRPRPPAALPRLGYANAPIGGVIINPGNTAIRDMSASRSGTLPRLDLEQCIHCGLCDMACPDFCFVWDHASEEKKAALLVGIDYQYCKGCQKCIVACPMGALAPGPDTEEFVRDNRIAKFKKG